MPRYFIYLLAIALTACHAKKEKERNEYAVEQDSTNTHHTTIKFTDATTINFGEIPAGDTIRHKFYFTNTGDQPLIINSAEASCGCTVAYFNKQPIVPGATDSIVATFASTAAMKGYQNKTITVACNTPQSPILLTMYGRVK